MPISARGEVQRLAVRRPVGPILGPGLRDRNPVAFVNRFRRVEGSDRDESAVGLGSDRETDPSEVRCVPAVEQLAGGMFQQWRLLMRSHVEDIDLIWIAAEHEQGLLVARPVSRPQASLAQLLWYAARRRHVHDPLVL